MLNRLRTLLVAAVFCASAQPAIAANILVNGDFETISVDRSSIFGSDATPASWGSTDANAPTDGIRQVVQGWQTAGYNILFKPNTVDTTGAVTPFVGDTFLLWGANNGGLNTITASPTGGNFVASDGGYRVAPIYQVFNDLVVGATYTLEFDWAAGQQKGFDGATTEGWQICFGVCDFTFSNAQIPADSASATQFIANPGSEIQDTGSVATPEHGFTPWRHETMVFTATSSTQKLSLLAYGTPLGQPPFSLIDGLSLDGPLVPEPATWMTMVLGFGVVGGAMRSRRRRPHGAQLV